MTHQEALACAARLAGAKLRKPEDGRVVDVTLVLFAADPRYRGRGEDGGIVRVETGHEAGLDDIVKMRDRIRKLGYDAELDGGYMEITEKWVG